MELFAKNVDDWKLLPISEKSSIIDVWQNSKYASVVFHCAAKYKGWENIEMNFPVS